LLVDITRERQLEHELQRSQRVELVGRLASGIAHDFNNLLTVVLSLAQLAKEKVPPGHPVLEDLNCIADAGQQAGNLAGQLLAFNRRRRRAPAEGRIDMSRVLRRSLELLRSTLPATIALEPLLSPTPLWVRGDETQLQQVLMNLCLNARDAMPGGGRLVVRTEAIEAGPKGPLPPADSTVRWARLSVEDSGEGMPEEVQARIFDPFFSTREHGSGLGLAVVQQIVTGYGGRVEVCSKLGDGSRFDVWLPRVE
jgi:signal transduction histidine kinase